MSPRFNSGQVVRRLRLGTGALLQMDSVPVVALGRVKGMLIVMQPGPNGDHPWVQVLPGGRELEYYVNLATVQEVELSDG